MHRGNNFCRHHPDSTEQVVIPTEDSCMPKCGLNS